MTTYNTGNPLGSSDPRDLYDNAENLDEAANSSADTFQDRLGKSRLTWAGMESQFDADQTSREQRFRTFIASSGYQFAGDYAAGIEITQYNQIIRDSNGEFWRVSGQVDLPYVTTGAGLPEDDTFVPAGDAVLRQDLANPDKGAAMVARGVVAVDIIAELLALPENARREDLRYLVKGYHEGSVVGGGEFYWDASSTDDPDGGLVMPASGVEIGRFHRVLSERIVTPQMFGARVGFDCTQEVQSALDSGIKNIYIPDGDYLINPVPGIVPPCGVTIEWSVGARFIVPPQSTGKYQVISLVEVDNVHLIKPNLVGDRDSHTGSDGEWGHGLVIVSSSNITIESPTVSDMWGDGIYIGRIWYPDGSNHYTSPVKYNQNITFNGIITTTNNRRNNVSVITVDGLYMDLLYARSSKIGVPPSAAIDFEPNKHDERISNVRINKVDSKGHSGNGLMIGLRKVDERTYPVSIDIANFESVQDLSALIATSGDLKGSIYIGTLLIRESYYGGANFDKLDNAGGLSVVLDRLVIQNCNSSEDTTSVYGSALSVWRSSSKNSYPLGNLVVNNLFIDSPKSTNGVYFSDRTPTGAPEGTLHIKTVERVSVSDDIPYSSTGTIIIDSDPTGTATRVLESPSPSIINYSAGLYLKLILGHETKNTIINLPLITPRTYGIRFTVVMRHSSLSYVKPFSSDIIIFGDKEAGDRIEVAQRGAMIELEASEAGWIILNCFGPWE